MNAMPFKRASRLNADLAAKTMVKETHMVAMMMIGITKSILKYFVLSFLYLFYLSKLANLRRRISTF